MRIVPGLTGVSSVSPSAESSRNSIVNAVNSAYPVTVPRIGTHRWSQQLGTDFDLMSSVPHGPDNEPEHRAGFPALLPASASKTGCPVPSAALPPIRTELRWRKRSWKMRLRSRGWLTAQPAAPGESELRSELPAKRHS